MQKLSCFQSLDTARLCFLAERREIEEDWNWYEKYIVNYFINDLNLGDRFTPEQIHRAVGLINVNAVSMKFAPHPTRKDSSTA